ncbi:hypothetical protein CFBP2044_42710 [Xanthomonas hortorum pv. cynarae]|nr:hypothetical protein CFBP2044_42710 [Xanthomonas hortorum pv. cynarae]CAD0358192.1 hypothetical protein CFBP2044_42710 [Xanthomonas hortorum pv. cynarae]
MRWSSDTVAMLPRITSNLPLRIASLYSHTAISTMKPIGKMPLAMPSSAAPTMLAIGMPNTSDDTATETSTASDAAVSPLSRSTVNASKKNTTGKAASKAERLALPSGS